MPKKSNPRKFDRCVKAVKKRGGANAYAVCTAAGTRNKGKRRKNIIPLVPLPTAISQSSEAYQVGKFLRTGKFNKGKTRQNWPWSEPKKKVRLSKAELQEIARQQKEATASYGRPASASTGVKSAGRYKGYTLHKTPDGEYYSSLDRDSLYPSKASVQKSIDAMGRRNRGKRNPAQEAIEAYADFHGQEPSEFVTVETQVHFHRHLAGAGDLKFLVIDTPDGKYRVTVRFKKGTLLAFNEKRNQLFAEGGDQSVDLKDFGIDPDQAHELETLGKATKIGYFTTKVHLSEEDGGTAVYEHKFRMTNQDGQHVTVRIARYPDVIYRVLDQHLEFSGGSYKILPEGIDR